MIQRKQTLFLLLAAVAGAGTWFSNLWRAHLVNDTYRYFNGQSSYVYFVLMTAAVLAALVSIFLFKNRRLQLRISLLDLLLCLGIIALQYLQIRQLTATLTEQRLFDSATYLPAAFLPVLMVIFLSLAARGIYKDEKLVRSLNRLR